MIRWTGAGAVAAPETLQIRVTKRFAGRVEAGAPTPTRTLSIDEVCANIRFFTVGMRKPRTRPCTALVLSGVTAPMAPQLLPAIHLARAEGVERITVHAPREGGGLGALAEVADAAAMTVAGPQDIDALRQVCGEAVRVTAVVLLDEAGLAVLGATLAAVAAIPVDQVVLTWPLLGPEPPHADVVLPRLAAAVEPLRAAGIAYGLKGLPPCAVLRHGDGEWIGTWRSPNRWYVDADHQTRDALLFFPDVVRFAKPDVCRFCALSQRCDGVVQGWLDRGLAGRLEPV